MSSDTNEASGVDEREAARSSAAMTRVCEYSAQLMDTDTTPRCRAERMLRYLATEVGEGNLPVETVVVMFNHPLASFVLPTGQRMTVDDIAGLFAHRLATVCGYNLEAIVLQVSNVMAFAEMTGESATITTGPGAQESDAAPEPTHH